MKPIKDYLSRSAIRLSGAYLRHFARLPGSRQLYDRLVKRYLAWRVQSMPVKSKFGTAMIVRLDDAIGRRICFFGVWEPVITRYISAGLSEGDTFIDVGANIGYYSLMAAKKVGRRGRVYAIEASPTVFESLKRNIGLNPFENIIAVNVAVTETPTAVPVYLQTDQNVGNTTIMRSEYDPAHHRLETIVDGRPLQQIVPLSDLVSARFIKIDVEGAEWLVLQGMKDVLAQLSKKTEILLEVKRRAVEQAGGTIKDLIALLEGAGFAAYSIWNDYSDEIYFERRPAELAPLANLDFAQVDLVLKRPEHVGQSLERAES